MNIEYCNTYFQEEKAVLIRGRVKRVRILSKKLAFIVVEDATATIQVGIRSPNVPKIFDIVECEGVMKLSQTNEKTIWCENPKIIASNQGDLPSFAGITDGKTKTEKRYLDILTNPELKKNIIFRSKVVQEIRRMLTEKNFIEIETPILSNIPSGATAEPFITKYNAIGENYYLRIATEIPLKKAVIAGIENVFEIGKIFRNEGIDKTHNPEFTSLEMYQSYASLEDMKMFIIYLIGNLDNERKYTQYDEFEYDDLIAKYGLDFEKNLIKPTFVFGQPIEQTPLCSKRADGKANRFEFFINGFEIANAYQELVDFKEQSDRFNGNPEMDDGLAEALKYGCPPLAGMGIGIERLVMALQNVTNIADVIVFPTKRN